MRTHDQDKIEKDCYTLSASENGQAQIIKAAGARWCCFGRTCQKMRIVPVDITPIVLALAAGANTKAAVGSSLFFAVYLDSLAA